MVLSGYFWLGEIFLCSCCTSSIHSRYWEVHTTSRYCELGQNYLFFTFSVFDSFVTSKQWMSVYFKITPWHLCLAPTPHIMGKTNNTIYQYSNLHTDQFHFTDTWDKIDRTKHYIFRKLFDNKIFKFKCFNCFIT